MPSPAPAAVPGPVVLPGALSPLTADLVRGPRRPAVVLAAYRYGAYLAVGGRVLPVLSRDAVALPGAVRLAEPAARLDLGVRSGEVVVVGAGAVRLPGALVRGVRTWRPSRVRCAAPATADASGCGAVREALAEACSGAEDWLVRGVTRVLRTAAHDHRPAVDALVGRGPGLTPSGDDALAGALLLRRALGAGPRPGCADPLHAAVGARSGATTAVSAALLDGALGGWAAPEVVVLVDAVARRDAAAVRSALPPVLAIGHHSGRDLATGLLAAFDVLVPAGRMAA